MTGTTKKRKCHAAVREASSPPTDPHTPMPPPTPSSSTEQQQDPSFNLYFPEFKPSSAISLKEKARLKQDALPAWLSSPTTVPLVDDDTHPIPKHLDPRIQKACTDLGIHGLFPIQHAILPRLLTQNTDMLVNAPTGSGKTLAYVLPIVHRLSTRVVPRLRAVVVVPTRELVRQVYETFRSFTGPLALNLVMSCGGGGSSVSDTLSARLENRAIPNPGLPSQVLKHYATPYFPLPLDDPDGGHCTADILVTTPARLFDHLTNTPAFSLQHVQFLVLDEADRILNTGGHGGDWLDSVLRSMQVPRIPEMPNGPVRTDSLLLDAFPGSGLIPAASKRPIKLLFSATLTRNPEKLARVQLRDPILITGIHSAGELATKYVVPSTLHETMSLVRRTKDKPVAVVQFLLALAAEERAGWVSEILAPLVKERGVWRVLVFTKSVDSARQLAKVLDMAVDRASEVWIRHFSRELVPSDRKSILQTFGGSSCKVHVLVASDVLARGIDVAEVDIVMNYDMPAYAAQYIHRIGRTARAGSAGVAVTMLAVHQVRFFRDMMGAKLGWTRKWRGNVAQVHVKLDACVVGVVEGVYASVRGENGDYVEDEEGEEEEEEEEEEELKEVATSLVESRLTVFGSSSDDDCWP